MLQRTALGRRALQLGLMLATVLPLACHEGGGVNPAPPDGEELPIVRQKSGAHCHENRALQLVIRDEATLARVPIEEIQVDFEREMLLVVTLGRVVSDQYHVEIDRVRRQGSKLHVETRLVRPAADAPPVFATPYCLAVVPKCDLNVEGFAAEPPHRVRTWEASEPGRAFETKEHAGKRTTK